MDSLFWNETLHSYLSRPRASFRLVCFSVCALFPANGSWIMFATAARLWHLKTCKWMGCFIVFVFTGINMMYFLSKELQYVQFLNGNEHSTVGCSAKWSLRAMKNILFWCCISFGRADVCFSELRWLIVFKAADISICIHFYVFLSLWELTTFAFLEWCEAVSGELLRLAWIQNCSFLMSSKPSMK